MSTALTRPTMTTTYFRSRRCRTLTEPPGRLLKKVHPLRCRAGYPSERWVRRYDVRDKHASDPSAVGDGALHLFEQPGDNEFFQHPVSARRMAQASTPRRLGAASGLRRPDPRGC